VSAASAPPLLAVRGLRAAYGKIEALKGVDIEINAGEIVALIGANGAGKSTLMMTIFGRPRAKEGRIEFDGRDITGVPTHEIARLRIAQSPEGRRIFPRMSVAENLQMGADAADSSEADRAAGLERIFALFPRLKERMTQRGGTLSGGEQQMLAIGRALICNPTVLLMDEPSEGLAPVIVEELARAIKRLTQAGSLSMIVVEQNSRLALDIAARAVVMDRGHIVFDGASETLRNDPAKLEQFIGVGKA